MVAIEQKNLKVLTPLPESASREDIMYHIYLDHKLAQGFKDIEEGNVTSHEDLLKEVATW